MPVDAVADNLSLALRYLSQSPQKGNISSPELRQIHSLLVVSGYSHHLSFLTSLLLHCVSLPSFPRPYALSIFLQIRRPNVATYNALFTAFRSHHNTALFLYAMMRRDGISPNKHTFPLLLKSNTHIPFQIFAHSIKFGFGSDRFFCNTFLSVCANTAFIDSARKLFDEMPHRDVVAYTALMVGYVRTARARDALELFMEMRATGVVADEVAVVSALRAVGMLSCSWLGRWIHGFYIESGRVVQYVYLLTSLVDMYLKCGFCEDAMRVFRGMPYRNSVSWSALLAGYAQCSKFKDVLLLFHQMLAQKIQPCEAALATALTACANLGSLHQGRQLHNYINASKFELTSVLGTALIDMYTKCGCVDEALHVFDRMSVKDVYPWTALIHGFGLNGDATGALQLFSQMLSSGVEPNDVTLISILNACSHGGMITEGRHFFNTMERVHGIKPSVEHYGCMVDLLGRAGRLREAVELIEEMEAVMEPSAGTWGALFGACMIHKDYQLGRIVGNRLIKLQPTNSGRYAVLANMSWESGDKEFAGNVRKKMKEGGVRKNPGCSWVDINGVVHEFVALENLHVETQAVYLTLDSLTALMEQLPLVMDSTC